MIDVTLCGEVGGRSDQRMSNAALTLAPRDNQVGDLNDLSLGQWVRTDNAENCHPDRLVSGTGEDNAALRIEQDLTEPVPNIDRGDRVDGALGATTDLTELVPQCQQDGEVLAVRDPRDHERSRHPEPPD